jgi:uncharacterized protein YyaL (SSP411 family)
MDTPRNRLAREQSPYLLQHAGNPVDWYPWGEEALTRARREDRPILLSIGYSACHWCHVMERESFENETIASLMNTHFVNIKVDREERPDIDAVYMNALQMMTGSGGWPLTAFLDPTGRPFYTGTYFPPEDRYGRPGFARVLETLSRAWAESRDEVEESAQKVIDGFAQLKTIPPAPEALHTDTIARAGEKLLGQIDSEHGGFGDHPKFPNVPALQLLHRRYHATGRERFREAFLQALDGMCRGGVYDQIGGGFHRYSVDSQWLVPHFEKMLYDNAQLVPLYTDGYRLTRSPEYAQVVHQTLAYLEREMRHDAGGFYSTQDADTEGAEGMTYLWQSDEFQSVVGTEDSEILCRYYGVTVDGNFAEPGDPVRRNILNRQESISSLAESLDVPLQQVESSIALANRKLLDVRDKRTQPGRDEKILTSWNALAIRAFVHAANVFDQDAWLDTAIRCADFIAISLRKTDGMLRSWMDGQARHQACLDDYSYLAAANLDLWQATGTSRFLETAYALADEILSEFPDQEHGGFFLTSIRHEVLVDRSKSFIDGSLPSGNAVAAEVLQRLGRFTGEHRYIEAAQRTLEAHGLPMEKQPFGTAAMINVLEDQLQAPREVVIVGKRDETRELRRVAFAHPQPNQLVIIAQQEDQLSEPVEILRGKLDAAPVAYVCENQTCSAPISRTESLAEILRGKS